MDPNAAITILVEWSKQRNSSIFEFEIKNIGDEVLSTLSQHSLAAQHLNLLPIILLPVIENSNLLGKNVGAQNKMDEEKNESPEFHVAYITLHYLLNPKAMKRMMRLISYKEDIPNLNLEDKVNLRGRDVMDWTIYFYFSPSP